jgi:hypothetical protein
MDKLSDLGDYQAIVSDTSAAPAILKVRHILIFIAG